MADVAGLPEGTITFLFTDVEGSTRPAERYPQPMLAAQARHDAILSETVRVHGGACQPTGDGVCAVFATCRTRSRSRRRNAPTSPEWSHRDGGSGCGYGHC
jgi:class 3 adenylate cyclase